MSRHKRPIQIKQLLKKLRSNDKGDVIEAGIELNRSYNVPVKPLFSVLEKSDNPHNREFAAYALISPLRELESKISKCRRRRVFARRVYEHNFREKIGQIFKFLLKVIDFDKAKNVRGQALEALGMSWTAGNHRHKCRRLIEKSIVAALSDDSPEVRFWACYSAGSLKIKNALPKLRELTENDTQDWGQWWPVSEEAADAIEWVYGRYTEARIPLAQRTETEN